MSRIGVDIRHGLYVVVDGIPLSWEDLADIFATHEDWLFRLKIVDSSGEV